MKKFLIPQLLIVFALLLVRCDQNSAEHPMSKYVGMSAEAINKLPKYDRPDLAQLRQFEKTKDPSLGYPPVDRLFDAHDVAVGKLQQGNSSRMMAPITTWDERGPNNFGGRTRAVAFDPNDPSGKKIWAGGVGGGLWYNDDITDANSSWKVVNDFFGNIAVTALAFDPSDTDVAYFGTGEGWFGGGMIEGNGIWKTTDGGLSWDQLSSTDDNGSFSFVQKIIVTDNSTVLATTRDSGGVYRSTDGGTSWTRVISDTRGADLEIAGSTIYATTGIFSPGKAYKSVDDGETWTDITPDSGIQRVELGVNPAHPSTVYAVASNSSTQIDIAGLYRSFDSGETWTEVTVPSYLDQSSCNPSASDFARGQAWYDLILAVDPTNRNNLVVGGIDLHKSTDGGVAWDAITYWTGSCDEDVHADQHNFIFRPGFPDEAVAVTDGGVYYTSNFSNPEIDGGPDFQSRNKDYNVAQFYSCAMTNEVGGTYFLAGAQDNGSHQFTEPGINSTVEVTGGDGAFVFIDQDEPNIQITSYVYNAYRFSTDGFASFTSVSTSGSGDVGDFINPADYNSNTNTLIAAGNSNEIVRYVVDESISAEQLSVTLGGAASALIASPYDDDVVFVGTGNGKLAKVSGVNTTPVGTDITITGIGNVNISSVDVGASEMQLLATASNYGVVSIYESLDGGTTWEEKEGDLPDMPVWWALYNPNNYNQVLIATELGVWMTQDISVSSPVWNPVNDGLANVRSFMLQYREADGLVAVATHGRGLYTSDVFATQASAIFSKPDVAYVGQEVSFLNHSILDNSYAWDLGDGNSSTSENTTHTFAAPGIYQVELVINGDPGLTQTQEMAVLPFYDTDYLLANGGDFESNQNDFYGYSSNGSAFELGSSSIVGKDGTNSGGSAWVTDLDGTEYLPNAESYLYTPQFDFGLSGDYTLEFYTKYIIEDQWDGFVVEYSNDNGLTWTKLGDYLDLPTWYNQTAIEGAVVFETGEPIFSGNTNGAFSKKTTTFSELSGTDKVSFRFNFRTDPLEAFAGVAIDDFELIRPVGGAPNLAFASSGGGCVGETVLFENSSTGDIETYSWDFGQDASPATAEGFGPHSVTYTAEGTKTVTLAVTSSFGDTETTEVLEVTALPNEIGLDQTQFDLCFGETATIAIASPENGITYTLINAATLANAADPVVSDGTDFDFVLSGLLAGTTQYQLLAEGSGDCDLLSSTIVSVEVQEELVATITELSNTKIRSSFGDSYQWYLDGVAIDGATSRDLEYSSDGTYSVEVTVGDCTVLSEDAILSFVLSATASSTDLIYPNPVSESVNFKFNSSTARFIKVYDLTGSLILESNVENTNEHSINVSDLKPGLYHLIMLSEKESKTYKFIKK